MLTWWDSFLIQKDQNILVLVWRPIQCIVVLVDLLSGCMAQQGRLTYNVLNLLLFSNEWCSLSTWKFLKFVFRFFALLTSVVTSGGKTSYCSLRIFVSFVKLTVVINITEQSNVRSQNGSCASNSLTLVFLNFLRFYCLPRSLESLYVSFPVLLNLFRG